MSNIRATKFVILNIVGAMIWAIIFSVAGFIFGKTLEFVLDEVKRYEIEAVIAIVLVGSVIWIIHFYQKKKSTS